MANLLVGRDCAFRSWVEGWVEKQFPGLGKAVGERPFQEGCGREGSLPTLCMGFSDFVRVSLFFLSFHCHVHTHCSVGKGVFHVIKKYSF